MADAPGAGATAAATDAGRLPDAGPCRKPHIYTVEYYWAVKEKELLPSGTTRMGLEGIC